MTIHPPSGQPGTAWTEEQARRSARQLLAEAGIQTSTLRLLRYGNNGVFQVDERYVIRVARPSTPVSALRREVQIAQTLDAHGVPVVQLAHLPVKQPLIVGNQQGTVWEYLPGGRPTYQQFGNLLRDFHRRTDSLRLQLPSWRPLASARQRLNLLASQYPPADISLLETWYERLAAALDNLQTVLPSGIIHGQAEIGNAMLCGKRPVFLDLERVAIGPREWDLIDTAMSAIRFNLPRTDYHDFSLAYGFGVTSWSGFDMLRRVWELRATTWLMQNREHDPAIADEIQVRLATWRDDDPHRRWRGF